MPVVAIVTLIGVALVVVALVGFLIQVASILKHVNFTLGTIIAGVRAIAMQTEPLGPVMKDIETELVKTRDALEPLSRRLSRGAPPAAPAQQAHDAGPPPPPPPPPPPGAPGGRSVRPGATATR